jgi:flagellar hook-associated protein 2
MLPGQMLGRQEEKSMASSVASISSPGIGSGLDVNSIVSALMAVEQQPLTALQNKAQQYNTQISAYGQLQSAMSTFQNAMEGLNDVSNFDKFSATSSDSSVLSAQADSTATVGKHQIQVERLAQAHTMATATQGASTVLGGNPGDSLTIQVNSFVMNYGMSSGMTLAQLQDAINNDPNNHGVRAQLIDLDSTGTSQRLAIMSPATGYDNRLQLSGGMATTLGFTTTNTDSTGAAITDLTQLDAAITVDGIGVTRDGNTVIGLIPGVTMDLNSAKPGSTVILSVAQDTAGISDSVQAFATAYNTLMGAVDTLSSGDLQGDSTLRMLVNRVHGVINAGVNAGTFTHLSQVGLALDRNGVMQFSSDNLQKALTADTASVAKLFAGDGIGFASKFDDMAYEMLGYNGLVQNQINGLQQRLRSNQDDQTNMQDRLDRIQQGYYNQFTALDTLVSQMNTTSSYLTQQLAALTNSTKK